MTVKTKIKCRYSDKCSDVERLCGSCSHNELRSYYTPAGKWWREYWRKPYYPTTYDWTVSYVDCSASDGTANLKSYYTSG